MAGTDESSASFIDPTLERMGRLERAALHIARSVELELADIALSGVDIDSDSHEAQSLRELGAALLRISSISINTANSVAVSLGEAPSQGTVNEPIRPPASRARIPESTTPQQDVKEQVVMETNSDELVEASPVSEPEVDTTPSGQGRLDRQQLLNSDRKPRKTPTSERQVPRFEGRLYSRVIPEKQTPIMELREGMVAIPVRIITDDTIILNDEKIVLEGDELFAFNAFMQLRDTMITAKEMRRLGFRLDGPSASSTLSKAITQLMSHLEGAAGPEGPAIIKKIGQAAGMKYAVNPAVVLEDERIDFGDSNDLPEPSGEDVKKN